MCVCGRKCVENWYITTDRLVLSIIFSIVVWSVFVGVSVYRKLVQIHRSTGFNLRHKTPGQPRVPKAALVNRLHDHLNLLATIFAHLQNSIWVRKASIDQAFLYILSTKIPFSDNIYSIIKFSNWVCMCVYIFFIIVIVCDLYYVYIFIITHLYYSFGK